MAQLDADASVRNICVGTGKASSEAGIGSDLEAQYRYYAARPKRTGDLHGQAPLLWTAAALLR